MALLILITTVLTHGGHSGVLRYPLQVAPEAWLAGSGLVYVLGAVAGRIRRSSGAQ